MIFVSENCENTNCATRIYAGVVQFLWWLSYTMVNLQVFIFVYIHSFFQSLFLKWEWKHSLNCWQCNEFLVHKQHACLLILYIYIADTYLTEPHVKLWLINWYWFGILSHFRLRLDWYYLSVCLRETENDGSYRAVVIKHPFNWMSCGIRNMHWYNFTTI